MRIFKDRPVMSEFHMSEVPMIVEYLNNIIKGISKDCNFVSYTNMSMYAPGYIVMGRIFLKYVERNDPVFAVPTSLHLYAVKNINDRLSSSSNVNPFNFYVDFTDDKSVERSIIDFLNPLKDFYKLRSRSLAPKN